MSGVLKFAGLSWSWVQLPQHARHTTPDEHVCTKTHSDIRPTKAKLADYRHHSSNGSQDGELHVRVREPKARRLACPENVLGHKKEPSSAPRRSWASWAPDGSRQLCSLFQSHTDSSSPGAGMRQVLPCKFTTRWRGGERSFSP